MRSWWLLLRWYYQSQSDHSRGLFIFVGMASLQGDEFWQGHLDQHSQGFTQEEGTEIFGRFFIAMIAQAAQERGHPKTCAHADLRLH